MSNALHVWRNRSYAGLFEKDSGGRVRFFYPSANAERISLSLPVDRAYAEMAPANFLEGLLPDNDGARYQMQTALGARSTDPFDLLPLIDSTGGLVFTQRYEAPDPTLDEIVPATHRDIAAKARNIARQESPWWEPDERDRFSLAGTQGKFSLAIHDGLAFWPTQGLPSTHILKPEQRRHPRVATIEHATMEMARYAGFEVPENEVREYAGVPVYVIRRFDRLTDAEGATTRLHVEDLAQALGRGPGEKYDVEIRDVTLLFRENGLPEDMSYEFMRRYAFATCIGNWDAHAKNTSVFLAGDTVWLCPLYDMISMGPFPSYRYGAMSMAVNGKYDAWEVGIHDWRDEASKNGLDPDRVEHDVLDVAEKVRSCRLPGNGAVADAVAEIQAFANECMRDLI